jgi:hypothetical protein
MQASTSECTIERALRDPMTVAIMRADGVDSDALRHLLRDVALHVTPERPGRREKRSFKAAFCAW